MAGSVCFSAAETKNDAPEKGAPSAIQSLFNSITVTDVSVTDLTIRFDEGGPRRMAPLRFPFGVLEMQGQVRCGNARRPPPCCGGGLLFAYRHGV